MNVPHGLESTPAVAHCPPTCVTPSASSSNSDVIPLSLTLVNARSLCNKLDALFVYVDHYNPDIMAITETWGRPALLDSFITPSGYVLFRKDRADRFGGGVVLLVREEFRPSPFIIPSEIDCFDDSVWCVLQIAVSMSLLVGCFYRSPSSSAFNDDRLVSLFRHASQSSHNHCVFVGDFNCPDIDWNLLSSPPSSSFLLDCHLECSLTQVVSAPTRGDHLLDLVFVNDPTFVSSARISESFPGSDHKTVLCQLNFDNANPLVKKSASSECRFCFSLADWSLYRLLLSQTSWADLLVSSDVDMAWSNLKEGILAAAKASIPVSIPVKKIQGVPLSGSVRRAFRNRKRILRSLKHSNSPISTDICSAADVKLKSAIAESRLCFERKVAADCTQNPKRFWSHVRSSLACKPKVSAVFDSCGRMTLDDVDTAEAFNSYFASVFNTEPDTSELPSVSSLTNSEFTSFSITAEVVHSAIKALPSYSSPGPDGISNILLKEGGISLVLAIFHLFSIILKCGILPAEWKSATVVPIHKKGSRSDCHNFRPISLTCTMCKLLERILKDSMLAYLIDENLLHDSQHGFVPGRSCSSALLTFLEKVTSSLDNKQLVDVVYLDFSKAFDTVPHKRLLLKLKSFGFGGVALQLISSFLSGRQQRVSVGNSLSSYKDVTSGVPQGSVLGPLLFVLYIHDISAGIKSDMIKFADDIRLFTNFSPSDRAPCELLQNDLSHLMSWSATWLLTLNPIKCCCLHLGHNNTSSQYSLGSCSLSNVQCITDLGINFSADLKPSTHCFKVAARAHRLLSIFKLAFKFLDMHSLTCIYKSLVRPNLEYCSEVWCPYYVKDIDVLERVQRRFTRFLPAYRHLSYDERLKVYKLHTLYARRLCRDLTTVYKILHGSLNIDHSLFFFLPTDSQTRGHSFKIRPSYSRLDIRKFWFANRVVPLWNALPASCAEAPSVDSFKTQLWNHFSSIGVH